MRMAFCGVAFVIAALLLYGWFRPAPEPAEWVGTARPTPAVGPPWIYGAPEARYTIELYADLECPYCQQAVPHLLRWVDSQPKVRVQWHHLPLVAHDPAATRAAVLVECAGRRGSPPTFWTAVRWYYAHTRGNGRGLPTGSHPQLGADLTECVADATMTASIQADTQAAAADGISATPAMRIHDRRTGNQILLYGAVEADALLSALDHVSGIPPPP